MAKSNSTINRFESPLRYSEADQTTRNSTTTTTTSTFAPTIKPGVALPEAPLSSSSTSLTGDGIESTPPTISMRRIDGINDDTMIDIRLVAPTAQGNADIDLNDLLGNPRKPAGNIFLESIFKKLDTQGLASYQKKSKAHAAEAFDFLRTRCERMIDGKARKGLDELLDFAAPLLSCKQLVDIALIIARRPNTLTSLTRLSDFFGNTGFPEDALAMLRDAAGESGDSKVLEFVVNLDPTLTKLINGNVKPSKNERPILTRTLALAMQTGSDVLIKTIKNLGVNIDPADRALDGLPLLAILADANDRDNLALMTARNPRVLSHAIANLSKIKTVQGLLNIFSAIEDPGMAPFSTYVLLYKAVELNDATAVENLVGGGACISYGAGVPLIVPTGGLHFSLVGLAIQNDNLALTKRLVELGARYDDGDRIRFRHQWPHESFET